jgi:hypothetical protein
MAAENLSLRQLNRTLLARQHLLKRAGLDSRAAIESLVALQSQIPNPPYIGLWTRLRRFERNDLTAILETRQVVRAPWLRSTLHVILYVVKYLIIFPVFGFFWFAVLTLILAFLAKDQSFSETLLVALATVSTIRVTSYYNEDLSRDLAKILPFAVLAIFLIDASFFSVGESLDILKEAGNYTEKIVYSLSFIVVLELVLRIINGIVTFISRLGQKVAELGDPD